MLYLGQAIVRATAAVCRSGQQISKLITKDSIALASCKDIRALYDEMFLDEVIAEDAHHAPDGKIFRKGSTSVYSGANKIIHTG